MTRLLPLIGAGLLAVCGPAWADSLTMEQWSATVSMVAVARSCGMITGQTAGGALVEASTFAPRGTAALEAMDQAMTSGMQIAQQPGACKLITTSMVQSIQDVADKYHGK